MHATPPPAAPTRWGLAVGQLFELLDLVCLWMSSLWLNGILFLACGLDRYVLFLACGLDASNT